MPTWDSRIKQNAGATGAPRDAREGNGVGVARRALAASCWLLLLPGRRSAEAEAGDASFGAGREHMRQWKKGRRGRCGCKPSGCPPSWIPGVRTHGPRVELSTPRQIHNHNILVLI
jgi:hypothetical protein